MFESSDKDSVRERVRASSVAATSADFSSIPRVSAALPSVSARATSIVFLASVSPSVRPRAARPSSIFCARPSSVVESWRRRSLAFEVDRVEAGREQRREVVVPLADPLVEFAAAVDDGVLDRA